MPLSDYDTIFDAAGREWGIDPHILRAVAQQESAGNPNAVSKKGATGLMGIMPATGQDLGITNLRDPTQSIYAGAKYLSKMTDQFHRPDLALAAYNAGPQRVSDVIAGQATLPAETKAYLPAIAAHYQKFAGSAPAVTPPSPSADDDFLRRTGAAVGDASASKVEPDTDFLRRTGAIVKAPSSEAPTPTTVDEYGNVTDANGIKPAMAPLIPAIAAGAKARTSTVPAPAPAETVDEYGNVVSPAGITPAMAPAAPALGRIGAAAAAGYRDTQPIVTPAGQAIIGQAGPVGRYITNPVLHAIGAVPAGANALASGAAQAITEGAGAAGMPALGRDLNMLAQVAPMAGMGAGVPSLPELARPVAAPADNALASAATRPNLLAAPSAVPSPNFVPPGAAVPVLPRILQLIRADNEVAANRPAFVPPDAAQPPNPLASAPGTVPPVNILSRGEGVPTEAAGSVGAAARDANTPEPTQTRGQAQTDLVKSATQSAVDRAGPQGIDNTVYVPGVQRPLAAREFSAENSVNEQMLRETDPKYDEAHKAIEKHNNDVMKDYYLSPEGVGAGDARALELAAEARDGAAQGDLARSFDNEKPVNAQTVVDHIDDILAGPAGKRSAVVSTLKDVRAKLFNADGELEDLPSQLYGARQNLTDKLSKAAKGTDKEASDARLAQRELMSVKDVLDPTIERGAPGFTDYLRTFSEASKPIDAMNFLQNYLNGAGKITDVNGKLQLNRVQKVLDKVTELRGKSAPNAAKSLTEDQVQALVNMRNELAANAYRDELAKTKGSPTTRNASALGRLAAGPVGTAIKGAAELGTHVLLGATTGGYGNALFAAHRNVIRPALEARKASKETARLEALKNTLLSTKPNDLSAP